jgi:hypothetical protein
MLVTGRCNRNAAEFVAARKAGAEVLAYLDPIERPDVRPCALDEEFYMNNYSAVPLWGKDANGMFRVNYEGMTMIDIRKGSVWSNSVVSYVEKLMREDKVDGVFLDVVGSRLYSMLAKWETWPEAERREWTEGSVDLVRRIDALRRQINPKFIVVNNNLWNENGSLGLPGEQYVDGVCIERPFSAPQAGTFHANYAGRAFGNLGHRRVIVIAKTSADVPAWAAIAGVTHVTDGAPPYAGATPPAVPFTRLVDRPKTFGRSDAATIASGGMSADRKRGSKFTVSELGTLLKLSAYLDGNGGASGSQVLKLALYRDSGGVPGAKVAESSAVSINSGMSPRWVDFPASGARLDPGAYWIMILSGGTSSVARNYGDGVNNWYGNTDAYSDGASNPFGAGATGTGTLSLSASYTVGN